MLLGLWACDSATKVPVEAENVLARVHNQYLYQSEVADAYRTMGMNQDSVAFVSEYVKEWMTQRLLLFYGPQYITWDEEAARKKLNAYRYTLLLHDLHAQYVSSEINVPITSDEIAAYYEAQLENFRLSHDILRMLCVRLPLGSERLSMARACVRAGEDADEGMWDALLADSTLRCHWSANRWYAAQAALSLLPPQPRLERLRLRLKQPQYFEIRHNDTHYVVRVLDVRAANQNAPLRYVEEEIRRIILSKRRDAVIQALKEKIWNEAKRDNAIDNYL